MPGKKYKCGGCQRVMRSDNLKKHEKICRGLMRKESSVDSPHVIEDVVVPAAVKSKSQTQLGFEQKGSLSEQIDSEDSGSDSEDGTESDEPERMDIEGKNLTFIPDNPTELMKAFRSLYTKFHDNIKNMLLMLDELERMKCLSSEECKALKDHLQKKIES